MISTILCFEVTVDENDFEDDYLLPTLQIVLLINPFNKVSVLPYSLGSIEGQLYPKHRIKIWIRTELLSFDDSDKDKNQELTQQMTQMNGLTINMLRTWIRDNRKKYSDIEFVLGHDSVEDVFQDKYWTTNRFKHLIQMKSYGLQFSRQNWAQFVILIDSDVVLTNNKVFSAITRNEDLIAMAPMLYSLGTYSNFWAGITPKGYYLRTDDYLPILKRQRLGEFVVPMIHSCLFINLRQKKSFNLTFDSRDITQEVSPFDDMIAFGKSAKINGIDLHINNREVWGFILPPVEAIDSLASLEQDVIDLQLESLVEGPEFPVSSSLVSYLIPQQSDKLNVDDIYVINLVRRESRRKRMIKCLEILGIDAKIWKAFDGKEMTEEFIKSKGIKVMDGYLDPFHKRPVTFGEIGCFLSHYTIWEDIIQRNLSKVIVLEDDVRFERNFKNRWKKSLSVFDEHKYDFLYLGRQIRYSSNESLIDGLFVSPFYSYWTIGYMITKRGALKLIDAKPLENLLPVDEFLPIMYDKHPDPKLVSHFPNRNLRALSVSPLLIYPTHYVGDSQYISDTEDSNKLRTDAINPKHTEL